MQEQELLSFLQTQIPIISSLSVSVESASFEKVVLRAPLAPNHNHMGTAFGGSLSMLLILSGYTWLYNRLYTPETPFHVILQKSDVDYLAPVDGDMTITCLAPAEEALSKFLYLFERKGFARLELHAHVSTGGKVASKMTAQFVAQRS